MTTFKGIAPSDGGKPVKSLLPWSNSQVLGRRNYCGRRIDDLNLWTNPIVSGLEVFSDHFEETLPAVYASIPFLIAQPLGFPVGWIRLVFVPTLLGAVDNPSDEADEHEDHCESKRNQP